MQRGSSYPTRADVRAAIAAQHAKKPMINGQGRALPYSAQPEAYRAIVTEAQHVASHGPGLARDMSFVTDRSGDV